MSRNSLWVGEDADGSAPRYPSLPGDQTADVVVVGAGLVGLTTATLLVRTGRDVVVLEDQAQFDPVPYLRALAAEVNAAPNGAVFERTQVTAVRGLRDHVVVTDQGRRVRARHVVVATLLPILDRGLFFANPKSSYIVALRASGDLPTGMYLSVDEPTRSLRTASDGNGDLLLVGGNGHPTGKEPPHGHRYDQLADWARGHFPVTEIVAQWSAHDYETADHLPWVGPSSPLTPHVTVATGFEKWGMTMGTPAGLALRDRIVEVAAGASAPWADLFAPTRLARNGFAHAARMNTEVAVELTSGWVHADRPPSTDGSGARHRRGILPVGDAEPGGEEVVVVCSHLGGVCTWNDAEHTWDCPLHGSRFEADGTVLTGPATRPLRTVQR